jgi:hypothetical protein
MDNMIKSWMEMEMEAPLPLQNYIRDHIFVFFFGEEITTEPTVTCWIWHPAQDRWL